MPFPTLFDVYQVKEAERAVLLRHKLLIYVYSVQHFLLDIFLSREYNIAYRRVRVTEQIAVSVACPHTRQ